MTEFQSAVAGFVSNLQERLHEYYKDSSLKTPTIEIEFNKKYVRLWKVDNQKSCWGFVEVATGMIFKPAGWKAPEKNFPRGNVYDQSSWASQGVYSPSGNRYVAKS